MITMDEIRALEAERKRIRSALDNIGREIYAIRHGEELMSGFRLSSYMFGQFDGTHYAGMDDTDWDLGTPLISITYYNSGWEQTREITFPQAWLIADYKQLETDRMAAIAEEARLRSEEDQRIAAAAREEGERQTYARLKEKFG